MTYISGGTLKGVVRMKPPTTVPGLSVANEGRIYYDSVSNQFKSSENGSPYVTLGAPALLQTVMPQWPSLTNGPVAQTASLGMLGFAGSMDLRDGFAYVGDYANPTGRILVIDVSAPDRPILVGTVSSASLADPTTIVASGSYLMVARLGGVSIVDVTSPASPTVVGTLALSGGQDHYGILVGSIFWVWETTTARLNAVDVSDPTNPVIVGQLSPVGGQTCLANAFARDTLYSVTWSNYLLCIDVSNPAAPTLLGSVSTGGGSQPSAIAVDGRTAYVVCYGGASLQCYDISNPASPTLLGSVATGWGGGGAISLLGDGLVLISGGGGALVVDATDPTAPVVTVPLFTTRVYPAMYPRGRWLHGVYYTGSTYAFGTWDTSSAQLVSPELGCARANTLEVRDRLDANILIVDRLEIGKGGVVDWSRTGGTGGRWSVLDKQRGGTGTSQTYTVPAGTLVRAEDELVMEGWGASDTGGTVACSVFGTTVASFVAAAAAAYRIRLRLIMDSASQVSYVCSIEGDALTAQVVKEGTLAAVSGAIVCQSGTGGTQKVMSTWRVTA